MTNETLGKAAPRPRPARIIPRYPRQLFAVGTALSMAACMGAAPSPHDPAVPTQTVQAGSAASTPPTPAATSDQDVPFVGETPPPMVEDNPMPVPIAEEPVPEAPQTLSGTSPAPFVPKPSSS